MLLYQIVALTINGEIKKSFKKNKFEISVPTRNKKLELDDGSYSISGIWNYFEYIFKKHGEKNDNPSIIICVNKTKKLIK